MLRLSITRFTWWLWVYFPYFIWNGFFFSSFPSNNLYFTFHSHHKKAIVFVIFHAYDFLATSLSPLFLGRDPFWWNSTSSGPSDPVEVVPCASGWCGKATEGKDGDHLQATERICLQRPPSDFEERCSETFYDKKRSPVFMCFCKGDLCNRGDPVEFTNYKLLMVCATTAFYIASNSNILWWTNTNWLVIKKKKKTSSLCLK